MKVERRLAYTSNQFMADAIVCTVDSNGNPDTPDSREAFKAGGLALEKYSSALSLISLGEAVVGPGFNLRNQWVILARSVHYIDDVKPEESLQKTYQSILRLCAECDIKSLALPVIGSGLFEFPREICMQILVQSLTQYAPKLAPDLEMIRVCLPVNTFELEFDAAKQVSDPTDQRPNTVEAAVEYLLKTMPKTALEELATLQDEQLIQTHYGLAAGIRNGVLHQNPALRKATQSRHLDDASSEIVKALWLQLQGQGQGGGVLA